MQINFIMEFPQSAPSPKHIPHNTILSNASTAFKSTGRMTNPHWGNRFVKDFNDLTYDISYDIIKGKSQLNQLKRFAKNPSTHSRKTLSATMSTPKRASPTKHNNMAKIVKTKNPPNPERHIMVERPEYSTIDTQGLCKHEFEKTIRGRMTFKSNLHLLFDNQTERSKILNKVEYDHSEDISYAQMKEAMKRNQKEKSHDFHSYTSRKVFQPKEELDKFYNTAYPIRKTNRNTIKETVQLDGLTGRTNTSLPIGTKLEYQDVKAKKKTWSKSPKYTIRTTKRELTFGRQVISPTRGCYR